MINYKFTLACFRTALETIDLLCGTLDFTDFASRIIHPLVRTLDCTPELRTIAMDTLASLVLQLDKKYQIFVPMVNKVLVKHRIIHQKYETLVLKIIKVGSNPTRAVYQLCAHRGPLSMGIYMLSA